MQILALSILSACGDDKIQDFSNQNDETFWKLTSFDSTLITVLAPHPAGSIFAANVGFDSGIFRSMDNGDNWNRLNAGLKDEYVRVLAIRQDGVILAATYNGQNSRFITSTDTGNTWSEKILPKSLNIRDIAFNSSGHVFIASVESDETSAGMFRSTDNGQNWTQINIPTITALDLEITPEGEIYAATSRGVFRSNDEGNSWLKLNEGLSDTIVLKLTTDIDGTLYASTDQNGIFRSMDEGFTWTQTGLVKPCIEVLMSHPNGYLFAVVGFHAAIYGCIEPEGIYFSTDKGETWEQLNEGLTDKKVASLAFSSDGYMFAGTTIGIFRSTKTTTQ
ncbi:MAG: hypothetical protein GWN55_08430 [Phycisphaerae bacterium]|nr:hypothetical protein [candidate division KSB1 bacterium]NIV01329.1 hypothetical protein [Phycisphaerae bacterium]NIR71917.1 hypothetical protein [candidate division KSB1 bacterium]NIS28008.1 hypothetical protein [candidate division KSB1 bacterium]NIT74878.1 hypothetical protein [candidate division KSB1 bacterium]